MGRRVWGGGPTALASGSNPERLSPVLIVAAGEESLNRFGPFAGIDGTAKEDLDRLFDRCPFGRLIEIVDRPRASLPAPHTALTAHRTGLAGGAVQTVEDGGHFDQLGADRQVLVIKDAGWGCLGHGGRLGRRCESAWFAAASVTIGSSL